MDRRVGACVARVARRDLAAVGLALRTRRCHCCRTFVLRVHGRPMGRLPVTDRHRVAALVVAGDQSMAASVVVRATRGADGGIALFAWRVRVVALPLHVTEVTMQPTRMRSLL